MYRAGATTRQDPHLFNMMASISKQLTDEEIGGLSSYLQGLHPAANDVGAGNVAAAPVAEAAPASTEASDAENTVEAPVEDAEAEAAPDATAPATPED
jgi:hypothetical protein